MDKVMMVYKCRNCADEFTVEWAATGNRRPIEALREHAKQRAVFSQHYCGRSGLTATHGLADLIGAKSVSD